MFNRKKRIGLFAAVWLAASFFASGAPASARSFSADTFSEGSRAEIFHGTLRTAKKYPWFDSDKSRPRFIPPEPMKEPRDRKIPERPYLKYLFYAASTILLLLILAVLVWLIRRFFSDVDFRRLQAEKASKEKKRRLSALAPEAAPMFDRLFDAAQEAFAAGDYRLAIIYFFSGTLVELDKAGALRLQKGRTNHDFDRQLKKSPALRELYRPAMLLFEDGYYGDHLVSRESVAAILPLKEKLYTELARLKALAERKTPPFPGSPNTKYISLLLTALFLFSAAGCRSKYWENEYVAYLPDSFFDESVNGSAEFRDLCRGAGGRVTATTHLTRRAEKYDAIVWFEDDWYSMATLNQEAVDWYSRWLAAKPGRALVLVADGWRADLDYWESVEPLAPPKYAEWIKKKITAAREYRPQTEGELIKMIENVQKPAETGNDSSEAKTSDGSADKADGSAGDSIEKVEKTEEAVNSAGEEKEEKPLWFRFEERSEPREASGLAGNFLPEAFPDSANYTARLYRRLEPLDETETILTLGGEPVVLRRKIGGGEVYIVHSGFFMLNYPLMKTENRLLASALLERIRPEKRKILFLHGSGVPSVPRDRTEEPISKYSLGRLSTFSIFVWQLIFFALAIFFWRWPITGRPKEIPTEKLADFSRHLDALGDLLKKTGDVSWAENELRGSGTRRQ